MSEAVPAIAARVSRRRNRVTARVADCADAAMRRLRDCSTTDCSSVADVPEPIFISDSLNPKAQRSSELVTAGLATGRLQVRVARSIRLGPAIGTCDVDVELEEGAPELDRCGQSRSTRG